MSSSCNVDEKISGLHEQHAVPPWPSRRGFLQRSIGSIAGLTCADFLSYFSAYGMPDEGKATRMAKDATRASENPRFLVYWYLEGGWCGYDMFNPVNTENNVLKRLDNISDERYRVLEWGQDDHTIKTHGNVRYGYLAEPGMDLFADMAILSSMHTGSGHPDSFIPSHGDIYSTALLLSGINPNKRGRNERSALPFIVRNT